MSNRNCFIIAEIGVNHNGSEEIAKELIDAACAAKADAVKFQTFQAERLVTESAQKAHYQQSSTGAGSQLGMLRELELSEQVHIRLAQYCARKGIEFMSTAFDELSASFLIKLGIRRIKIPSGELTNLPFITFLASQGLPIVLSTGMGTLKEVEYAIDAVRTGRRQHRSSSIPTDQLTLLHCTSNYPTELRNVNLRAMQTLSSRFGLPVGYSDHTADIFVAPMAVAMGATIIEKHFTLDRSMKGPDHRASLEPDQLTRYVSAIRSAETALGSSEKKPTETELDVRIAARRSITMTAQVPAHHVLAGADLTLLRPGNGILPCDLDNVIGRRTQRSLSSGHTLQWEDLEP